MKSAMLFAVGGAFILAAIVLRITGEKAWQELTRTKRELARLKIAISRIHTYLSSIAEREDDPVARQVLNHLSQRLGPNYDYSLEAVVRSTGPDPYDEAMKEQ